MSLYRLGAAAALAAALVACGQSPGTPAAPGPSGALQSSTAGDAGSAPADGPEADTDADMVSAVGSGGAAGAGSISVKFRVEARPMVGMPVKIMVAVIPAPDAQINHLHGSFLAGTGLQLQSEHTFDVAAVRAGTTLYRELTVVPQQTGVLSLNATLLIEQDSGSQARTYSIPVIASDSSG
jgi:hypothetical protein